MQQLESLFQFIKSQPDVASVKARIQQDPALVATVYESSVHALNGTVLFLAGRKSVKRLYACGAGTGLFQELEGMAIAADVKECELTVANSLTLRKYFPFTNPVALAGHATTIGLGDRLGLATPGHLQTVKSFNVRPVLAQQSIRELNLTGRTYAEVLADAVWAVFQEDYQGGFGADGDHLKTPDEVRMALDNGYTMITLDCSEHIKNIPSASDPAVETHYGSLDAAEKSRLEAKFLGKTFEAGGLKITFSPELLRYNAAVYQRAINFAIGIYQQILKPLSRPVDFEVSIDETQTATDPASHFFVALQLVEAGVKVVSLAPRFCGEFQKGVDYQGDIEQFEKEFKEHFQIAEHFGYKVSVHSGSDKFSIFPIVGRESGGKLHVKTAGTNWLEAVRVIAAADPGLYREMHRYALEHFGEAKKYYHVTTDLARIPNIDGLSDASLPELLYQKDARQLLHITYGLILLSKDEHRFRERIYDCLAKNEDLYAKYLRWHIGNHLRTLLYAAGV